jgi:hypothetical protein
MTKPADISSMMDSLFILLDLSFYYAVITSAVKIITAQSAITVKTKLPEENPPGS